MIKTIEKSDLDMRLCQELKWIEERLNMAVSIQRYFLGALDNGKFVDMAYPELCYLQDLSRDLINLAHEEAGYLCEDFGQELRVCWHHPTRSFRLGCAA